MDWYQERARRAGGAWEGAVAGLPLGSRVAGEVFWHEGHNHQVLLRLDAWT